jgi:hypothetical protein
MQCWGILSLKQLISLLSLLICYKLNKLNLKLSFENRSKALPTDKVEQKEFETTILDIKMRVWNLLIAFIGAVFHQLSRLQCAEGVTVGNVVEGSLGQFDTTLFASC